MRVQVNPAKTVNGQPLTVRHPRSGRVFPTGPFDLTPADLRDATVLRLLPPAGTEGGVPGGRFGDLVLAPATTKTTTSK